MVDCSSVSVQRRERHCELYYAVDLDCHCDYRCGDDDNEFRSVHLLLRGGDDGLNDDTSGDREKKNASRILYDRRIHDVRIAAVRGTLHRNK
jgi:hypothetical protein